MKQNVNITIVNDNQYRWGADSDLLITTMIDHGWTKSGKFWYEPENHGNEAYTQLCEAVQPLPNFEPGNISDDHDYPTFTWRADLGCWALEN